MTISPDDRSWNNWAIYISVLHRDTKPGVSDPSSIYNFTILGVFFFRDWNGLCNEWIDDDKSKACFSRTFAVAAWELSPSPGLRANAALSFLGCLRFFFYFVKLEFSFLT